MGKICESDVDEKKRYEYFGFKNTKCRSIKTIVIEIHYAGVTGFVWQVLMNRPLYFVFQ
jgi:hypothetical protein